MRVGLIGIGTVGGGTYKILTENSEEIFKKTGKKIEITMVADTNLSLAKNIVKAPVTITDDATKLIQSNEVDIVIELIGGVGISRTFVQQALENKKHVVTANKALIAMHGEELVKLAKKNMLFWLMKPPLLEVYPLLKQFVKDWQQIKLSGLQG